MGNGFNLVSVENSDDPDHTDLLRYRSSETIDDAIRIAKNLGDDANFEDWEIESGEEYIYTAQSFLPTGGFTYSDPIAPVVQILDGLWITLVTRDSLTTNSALSLNLLISGVRESGGPVSVSHEFKGRKPVTYFREAETRQLEYSINIHQVDIGQLETLKDLFEADSVLCIRDNFRNKIFGRLITDLANVEETEGAFFGLTFAEQYFVEGV